MPSGAPDYWGTIVTPEVIASYLSDLADVAVPSPTDGYVFYWDAAASKWKCKAVPAGAWADITGKPSTFAPSNHHANHESGGGDDVALAASQITTGEIADARIPAAIARDAEVSSAISTHAALATGIHGVGANYLALAPAASHLIRLFTKGWTSGKYLQGAGVNVDPTEVDVSAGTQVKTKYETKDMTQGSGNVSYTGYGFKPTALIIFGLLSAHGCVGCNVPSARLCFYNTTAGTVIGDTNLARIRESDTAEQLATSVVSFDDDGFTLAWTKIGLPTGTATLAVFAFP